mmetsp:Transcript_33677/g.52021  ORF Transcript_33677/g.52021 Transcript_33677/m.52021 type:complete len:284 (+) Transcript_33677:278-1129(+)
MSMRALPSLRADNALHPLGLGVKDILPDDGCINVVFVLGLHIDTIFLVEFLLLDVGTHLVLLLLHLDGVAVVVNEVFGVFLSVGAKGFHQFSDFSELLNILAHFLNRVLLFEHDVLAPQVEVFDQAVQESIAVILASNLRANLRNIEFESRDVSVTSIDLLQELIGHVLGADLLGSLRELKAVLQAEFELPAALEHQLVFFLDFPLCLDNISRLSHFIEGIIGSSIEEENRGLFENTKLLREEISLLIVLLLLFLDLFLSDTWFILLVSELVDDLLSVLLELA